jgi:uncharacterized protein YggE
MKRKMLCWIAFTKSTLCILSLTILISGCARIEKSIETAIPTQAILPTAIQTTIPPQANHSIELQSQASDDLTNAAIVEIEFYLSAEDSDEIISISQSKLDALTQAFGKLGITQENIKITKYTIFARGISYEGTNPTASSYTFEATMQIKVTDRMVLTEVLKTALDANSQEVTIFDSGYDDLEIVSLEELGSAVIEEEVQSRDPEDVSNERGISVTGIGEASFNPDKAVLQIEFELPAEGPDDAVLKSEQISEGFTQSLIELGVAQEDITTTQFKIIAQTISFDSGLSQYAFYGTLQVKISNLEMLQEIFDIALAAGAQDVVILGFGVADNSALISEAQLAALEDAKTQAQIIADQLGIGLGDPMIIRSSVLWGMLPYPSEISEEQTEDSSLSPKSKDMSKVVVNLDVVFPLEPSP